MSYFSKSTRFEKKSKPKDFIKFPQNSQCFNKHQISTDTSQIAQNISNKKKNQENNTISEVYKNLLDLIQNKVKTLKNENSEKYKRIEETSKLTKLKFNCEDNETGEEGKVSHHSGLLVRIIKTPTNKKLGPGTYSTALDNSFEKCSFNIMDTMQKMYQKQISHRSASCPRHRKNSETSNKMSRNFLANLSKLSSSRNTPLPYTQNSSSKPKNSKQNSTLQSSDSYEFQILSKQEKRKKELDLSARKKQALKKLVEKSQIVDEKENFAHERTYQIIDKNKIPSDTASI